MAALGKYVAAYHVIHRNLIMKIDNDLRQVIKAAHKRQRQLTSAEKSAITKRAIEVFLNGRPATKRQVLALMRRKAKLMPEIETLGKQIDDLLHPLGLDDDYASKNINLRYGQNHAFVEAGGDLTAITHHEWDVDLVLSQLAAAAPKDAHKILSKYGINWD